MFAGPIMAVHADRSTPYKRFNGFDVFGFPHGAT
jgi:hypothetical protein